MPNTVLRKVESGARSTLYVSEEGTLYRRYHDTDTWDGPLPVFADEHGTLRSSQNRTLDTLVAMAWDSRPHNPVPPYMRRVAEYLLDGTDNTKDLALRCGIAESTAWNYAYRVVELWPEMNRYVMRLVYPPLIDCCIHLRDRDALRGPLKEVMKRVANVMRGDTDWRCLTDRYAHLRVGRACVICESQTVLAPYRD